jgi:hypothetical protein
MFISNFDNFQGEARLAVRQGVPSALWRFNSSLIR